mmetsp:Transcript_12639/g.35686  ORF Transcript_12639/g.35686 Transcript_12639/m.35686 type:complete len:95 (+) Transcript_12639:305-589(+)
MRNRRMLCGDREEAVSKVREGKDCSYLDDENYVAHKITGEGPVRGEQTVHFSEQSSAANLKISDTAGSLSAPHYWVHFRVACQSASEILIMQPQ